MVFEFSHYEADENGECIWDWLRDAGLLFSDHLSNWCTVLLRVGDFREWRVVDEVQPQEIPNFSSLCSYFISFSHCFMNTLQYLKA